MSEKIINCAIYTRKSTEEGLEQDFNSLDNQYEFCTNYLKSLNDPTLYLLPTRYDDGGYSGGSLNRPALQCLLADIRCGLVNRVIIYKIDRLTREIRDFFKLLDVFEKYNVEFVSVKENQYYNTTTAIRINQQSWPIGATQRNNRRKLCPVIFDTTAFSLKLRTAFQTGIAEAAVFGDCQLPDFSYQDNVRSRTTAVAFFDLAYGMRFADKVGVGQRIDKRMPGSFNFHDFIP